MGAHRAWRRRALARVPSWRILALVTLSLLAVPATGLAEDTDPLRFYWSFRLGIGDFLDTKQNDGLEIEHEALLAGMSVGVNLGRYLGAELAGDVFNTDFHLSGRHRIGEYGTFSLIPQVRVRAPARPALDGP